VIFALIGFMADIETIVDDCSVVVYPCEGVRVDPGNIFTPVRDKNQIEIEFSKKLHLKETKA